MPGVVAVIENGNFHAVVTQREWQAIQAMRVAQDSDYVRKRAPFRSRPARARFSAFLPA
jgi:hypothetical protein